MLSRNAGCRLAEYQWKGCRVLHMENELLRIEILVDKGTDIVEFLYKPSDTDLMWRSPIPFYEFPKMIPTIESRMGSFVDHYPGGWQEIFPNGGPPSEYKGTSLGVHGEIALLPWDLQVLEDTPERIRVRFAVRTYRTPFSVEKTLSLERNRPVLAIEETVRNEAAEDMDFIWGHHPAVGSPFLSPDCRIDIPSATVIVNPGDGKALTNLKQGTGKWPHVEGLDGKTVDISRCPAATDRVSDVIILKDLSEGRYDIINERTRLAFGMTFPLSVFRCLWFWRVAGGSFNYPWYGRTYNIALEPYSSLPVLSKAIERGDQLTLGPGQEMHASITAHAKEM